MILRSWSACLAAAAALVFVTSGGCSSIPDITFADADGGPGTGDGGPCTATGAEICGDGIDNDCNGSADCADKSCSASHTCVGGVPSDWKVIAFADKTRPTCPAGFGESTDVRTVVGASGPPTCTCSCAGATTCASGDVKLALGNDAACGASMETLSTKAGCQKMAGAAGFSVDANTFVEATPPPTPACNATPSASALAPLLDGRVCTLSGSVASGCSAASSCVASAPGFSICVQKAGANSCPSAFPKAHRSGSSATDTRACTACTCSASPCSVDIKLHDNVNCGSTTATFKTSATCSQITNGAFTARASEATVTGGCSVATAPVGSGNLTLVDETTICCK